MKADMTKAKTSNVEVVPLETGKYFTVVNGLVWERIALVQVQVPFEHRTPNHPLNCAVSMGDYMVAIERQMRALSREDKSIKQFFFVEEAGYDYRPPELGFLRAMSVRETLAYDEWKEDQRVKSKTALQVKEDKERKLWLRLQAKYGDVNSVKTGRVSSVKSVKSNTPKEANL
jgi:hypothetical protein